MSEVLTALQIVSLKYLYDVLDVRVVNPNPAYSMIEVRNKRVQDAVNTCLGRGISRDQVFSLVCEIDCPDAYRNALAPSFDQ